MKNRPYSLILIGLCLVAWLTQVAREYSSAHAMLQLPGTDRGEYAIVYGELRWHAINELLPYAVICCVIAFISLPKAGTGFLGLTFVYAAIIGETSLSAYIGGGDMRGLGFLVDSEREFTGVLFGVFLALMAQAAPAIWRMAGMPDLHRKRPD